MICVYSNWQHSRLQENWLYKLDPLPTMWVSMNPINIPGISPGLWYELTWYDSEEDIAYYKIAKRWRG